MAEGSQFDVAGDEPKEPIPVAYDSAMLPEFFDILPGRCFSLAAPASELPVEHRCCADRGGFLRVPGSWEVKRGKTELIEPSI